MLPTAYAWGGRRAVWAVAIAPVVGIALKKGPIVCPIQHYAAAYGRGTNAALSTVFNFMKRQNGLERANF